MGPAGLRTLLEECGLSAVQVASVREGSNDEVHNATKLAEEV